MSTIRNPGLMAPIRYLRVAVHLLPITKKEPHFVTFIKLIEAIIFVAFVRVYSKLSKLMILR